MKSVFHWTAYAALPRTEALQRVQELVRPPAFITDFHFFSDLMASLHIEVPGYHCSSLFEQLQTCCNVECKESFHDAADGPILIMLQVHFASGTGKLSHPVPEVPG